MPTFLPLTKTQDTSSDGDVYAEFLRVTCGCKNADGL